VRLVRQKHVAGMLQRTRNRPLMLRRKAGVFARQDLAGIGDEGPHHLWGGERDLSRCRSLLLLFGSAHARKRRGEREACDTVVKPNDFTGQWDDSGRPNG
jgi:hypothetical protein